jgi:flavin reductase (DIM6/NTAB) family NADH-FMN oxidoreductase RutF
MTSSARQDPAAINGARHRHASADDYRDLMSVFPTGVAVITTTDRNGRPYGMTCSSIASVAVAPPTLLACLRTGSVTLRALVANGGFAVNFLHARGRRAAEIFSSPVEDRFGLITWRPSWSGYPWLAEDALALAECQVAGHVAVGDHTVVFGEVGHTTVLSNIPLLYGMRQFSHFAGRPANVARRVREEIAADLAVRDHRLRGQAALGQPKNCAPLS